MANSCKLTPTVHRRNGTKFEERDSNLFKDIKKAVQDNDTAWEMWAYTKTSDFKTNYGKSVEYDDFGEVTFQSLINVLGLKKEYDEQKKADDAAKDYGFNKPFENAGDAVTAVNTFNSQEKKFVAVMSKEGDNYKVDVLPRNAGNVEAARQQSYNYALTKEIIDLLRSIGFDVSFASNPEYEGLFDPENATLRDGLIQIISIAKGEIGERALPEEFSHLIIEGLINHPLVKRLLASITDEQIQEVLGDSFSRYDELYGGDILKLKKEAAGKMLAQHITGQGTISRPVIQPKRGLLSRVWNWAKGLFSKIKGKHLKDAKAKAWDSVAGIYNLVSSKEALPIIDKENILSASQLYKLSEKYNSLEKTAVIGEHIVARMLKRQRETSKNYSQIEDTQNNLKKIKELNDVYEGDKAFDSVNKFLDDSLIQLKRICRDQRKAERKEESGTLTDIKSINEAAKVAREIDNFVQGYSDIISTIATYDEQENVEELGLPNQETGQILANKARECLDLLNRLVVWRHATTENIVLNASRTVYKDDKVRGIDSKRNEIMSLEEILKHADRDINFVDRWLSAMSDADDALLTLFDAIVKNQQYERDMEMIEWKARIAVADEKLRKAGYTSEFMFELKDDGVPSGRIISEYDWDSYNEARRKYSDWLREHGYKGPEYSKALNQWKQNAEKGYPRLIKVYVDPAMDALYKEGREKEIPDYAVYEMVPNPKVFKKKADTLEKLAPAQREYYEEMMEIKRQMMTKIPHRGQGIYRAVYISKDFMEGLFDSGNPLQAVKENYKRKFLRRPDDIGFGTGERFKEDVLNIIQSEDDTEVAAERILQTLSEQLDDDIEEFIPVKRIKKTIDRNKDDAKKAADAILETIAAEDFILVDTDFANHRIQKLPIYYTRPLKNMKMLSTDFSGSMVAYSAMAVNYEKMNEVVDILEEGRKFIKERGIKESEGNKSLVSKFSVLGKSYRAFVEKAGNGSLISGRFDDYMSSVVYEERKNDEGQFEVLGANIDTAKVLDTIKDYTGLLGLGFNLFSTVSNIAVGKLQQWIEAAGGEYFTFKDYAKAVVQYNKDIVGCLAEIASPIKKNKLSLLIQMFDPMGDYYEDLRNANFSKKLVSEILGNGALAYIGMNAGEHMLHCQTMLAILNNIKLINIETKEKISLYDALEVKEVHGITKLVLKPNLAYERELIDNTGISDPENRNFNKNFGRPLRDENGKIKTELVRISDPEEIKEEVKNQTTEQVNRRHGTYDADQKPKSSVLKDFNKFIFKKKKVVRKVNDSLNGAFSVNDKGALHKKAIGRLIMQFRQWMPAHYMRRFARAHYDADLEQWREGYYGTVVKTINQIAKDCWKAKTLTLKYYGQLSEHEKANLRRATAELSEFFTLLLLVRLGGKVKDRDRSWLDKMALYQIRRMYLEVGASMPLNTGFFSNIFTLLQSPAASINTFEKLGKIIQFWNMFDEIQTGRYQGWSEWQRDVYQAVPALGQIRKAIDFDDSMFSMFEKDN